MSKLTSAFKLTPERALAFFRAKGLKVTFSWQDMLHEEHDHAFTVAKMADLDLLAEVQRHFDRALAEGLGFKRFAAELRPKLEAAGWWGKQVMTDPETGEERLRQLGSPRRLRTIYDANMRTSYAAGTWAKIEQHAKARPYVMYSAVMDARTRPLHAAWNGTILRWDDPWWQTHTPPNGWNCFLPGTRVRGRFEIGLKTFYSGPAVQIETASGERLRVTANHPILTERGWMPAHALDERNALLRCAGDVDAGPRGIVDDEQPPAVAEQLFETLAAQSLAVVPMAAHDFHGDAFLREAEIHVAAADPQLVHGIRAERAQRIEQFGLEAPDQNRAAAALVANRAPVAALHAVQAMVGQDAAHVAVAGAKHYTNSPARQKRFVVQGQYARLQLVVGGALGAPGAAQLALDPARRGLDRLPLDVLGLALPAPLHAVPAQQPVNGAAAAAHLFRELQAAYPGAVTRDQVSRVRKFDWSGHVYDFQTGNGLIVAEGLVTSNCRCTVISLDERGLKSLGKSGPDQAPPSNDREWINPRTGEVILVPAGIDPGWGYAPGASRRRAMMERLALETAAAAPAPLGEAALPQLAEGLRRERLEQLLQLKKDFDALVARRRQLYGVRRPKPAAKKPEGDGKP